MYFTFQSGQNFDSPAHHQHVEESLSRILNSKLLLMSMSTPRMAAFAISACVCVCEWVKVSSVVKHVEQSLDFKSTIKIKYINHLPFTVVVKNVYPLV